MNRNAAGAALFVAAAGMLFGLLGKEIAALHSWPEAVTPAFIGESLMHVGAVIGAFVAGQVVPTSSRFLPKE